MVAGFEPRDRRRGGRRRCVALTLAALPALQVSGCTNEDLRRLLISELTQQISEQVFVGAETIFLNLFGV